MKNSQSISAVKLDRKRKPTIIEIIINPNSFHLVEHLFLTMSIVGWNETNFPTRHKDSPEKIKSTIVSKSEISGPMMPQEIVGSSHESTTFLDPMKTVS